MTTTSEALMSSGRSGLLKRSEFFNEIRRLYASPSEAGSLSALLVINFQQHRDFSIEFGHRTTELIVHEIARRIGDCLRQVDCLGRLGSADFILLLPKLRTQGQVIMAINKIQRICQEPVTINGKALRVRLAFGGALSPQDGSTINELLGCAETALRYALSQRRESAFFADLQKNDLLPVVDLARNFSTALERSELDSVYQPIINLDTGDLVAAEMVARWDAPDFGMIAPEMFFKIAEDGGLLAPLTLWAINKGLRECSDWQPDLPTLSVAINISASVLCEPHLSASLFDALKLWDAVPEQLTIEITEKSLLIDPDVALKVLSDLHAHGVKIAIDHFGTGYSSLAYLKRLPISGLKIDESFVKNMLNNPADRRIVKSVIDLAHNFELSVVADGVEDEETLDALTLMGCQCAQGDLIGPAMLPSTLTRWLSNSPWTLNTKHQLTSPSISGLHHPR